MDYLVHIHCGCGLVLGWNLMLNCNPVQCTSLHHVSACSLPFWKMILEYCRHCCSCWGPSMNCSSAPHIDPQSLQKIFVFVFVVWEYPVPATAKDGSTHNTLTHHMHSSDQWPPLNPTKPSIDLYSVVCSSSQPLTAVDYPAVHPHMQTIIGG